MIYRHNRYIHTHTHTQMHNTAMTTTIYTKRQRAAERNCLNLANFQILKYLSVAITVNMNFTLKAVLRCLSWSNPNTDSDDVDKGDNLLLKVNRLSREW